MIRIVLLFGCAVCLSIAAGAQSPDRPKLILDADSANEIDDMYAIARLLNQENYEVLGISSAQWFHYLGDPDSVQASQDVNETLVKLLGRHQLPVPQGAERPMGKPWGGYDPKDSPAAQFIIRQASIIPDGDFLHVACIGASTNLASAIKLSPEIAPKIKAYVMGFRYDANSKAWNKSEFNVRRDLNAADFLLNQSDLELHVMTATISESFKFDQDDTFTRHKTMGPLGEYLTSEWKRKFGDSKSWTMWDLALIEAMLHPEFAHETQVMTPPENTRRKVWIYDSINIQKMKEDYWQSVQASAR
jgi:inosine-uridine nucleoside N-ribohydrolase